MKVINNADDYGYSNAINYGIIDSYKEGALTSTTIMAGMPGFDHAVMLAKQNPGLGIGVHLTLTCGKPLLNSHKTLVDETGNFKKLSFYKDETTVIDQQEVYDEWKSQIEKVLAAGIKPTHLDSHHHSHTLKNNTQTIIQLAKEYNLPVRKSFDEGAMYDAAKIEHCDLLIDPWLNSDNDLNEDKVLGIIRRITKELEEHQNLDCIEIMWHPAYMDKKIMKESGFNLPRLEEVNTLLNQEFIKYLNENYELCTYKILK